VCLTPAIAAVASLVVGVAQAGLSYAQASQAADRQNQYYEMNKAEANRALVNSYAGQQNRMIQERNAASQKKFETSIEATKARATAVTAAGEAGVGGLSVDALLGDYMARESRGVDAIDQNFAMSADAIRSDMEGSQGQANARINSVQQAAGPSFLDAAVRVAGSVVGAAGTYYQMKSYEKVGAPMNINNAGLSIYG
jgi:hypothetical protein